MAWQGTGDIEVANAGGSIGRRRVLFLKAGYVNYSS